MIRLQSRLLTYQGGIYYGAGGAARPAKSLISQTYTISKSASNTRSSPTDLAGSTVTGTLYAFVTPTTNVQQVTVELRESNQVLVPIPGGVSPNPDGSRTEASPPYDLAGGDPSNNALGVDTFQLPNGTYIVNAFVELTDGSSQVATAMFTVQNAALVAPSQPAAFSVTISGSTITAPLSAPSTLGNPEWTGRDVEWWVNGALSSVAQLGKTATVATRTASVGDVVYARVRNINGTLTSAWVQSSNSVTVAAPTGGTRSDTEPLGGLQATTSNRRSGIECGVPSGQSVSGSGGLSTSSSAGISNRLFTSTITYSGTADKYIRNSRIRFEAAPNQHMVRTTSSGRLFFIDCEVDGILESEAIVSVGRVSWIRPYIHHVPEGPRVQSGVEVFWGRIEKLTKAPEWTSIARKYNHDDCIQSNGSNNWHVQGMFLDARRVTNRWGGGNGYAAIQISGTSGAEADYNLMNGGNFCFDGSGSAGTKIHHNQFLDNANYGYRNNKSGDVFNSYNSSTGYGWHPSNNIGAPGSRYAGKPVPTGVVL